MNSRKIQEVDLYELLGVSSTSSTKEIKSAFRKRVLTCHPDKCPDDPKAVELFHELSKALEILTDKAAREAYDDVQKAKQQAKQRRRNLSSRYKKMREDLEERERKAHEEDERLRGMNFEYKTAEDKLEAEIDRLRKEGSLEVKVEQEAVRQQLLREARVKDIIRTEESAGTRLRVQWKADKNDTTNGGYDYATLHHILSKHGKIAALIISSKKKGSALVDYSTVQAAELAREVEQGMTSNPLCLRRLWEPNVSHTAPSPHTDHITSPTLQEDDDGSSATAGGDFEDLVLSRLRQAAQKQAQGPS